MARASNRHTSEELFITIKAMTKAGLTAKEICKIMKVGEPRVLCCRKFDTYEEYIDGRHDVYEGWSGDSRKTWCC